MGLGFIADQSTETATIQILAKGTSSHRESPRRVTLQIVIAVASLVNQAIAQLRFSFAFFGHFECNGDVTPIDSIGLRLCTYIAKPPMQQRRQAGGK